MINESKPQIFEKKETPKWESMRVFRIRHGDTIYREQSHDKTLKTEDMDLTEKGEQKMLADAEKNPHDLIYVAEAKGGVQEIEIMNGVEARFDLGPANK